MKKKINKNWIWAIISLLLAVLTIRVVLKQNKDMSLAELWAVIGSSKKIFLLLGVISSGLFIWFEGIALRYVLKHVGYPRSPMQGLLYSTSDLYFSAITPSATGGQPASGFFMMRDGIPGGMATAVLVLNLMMYTVSIIFLGGVFLIFCPGAFAGFGNISKILIVAGFVALTVLSVIFFILLKKEDLIFKPLSAIVGFFCDRGWLKGRERKLARLNKIRDDYASCSALISGRGKILLGVFAWNCVQRSFQMVVPVLTYWALGGPCGQMLSVFTKQCLVTIGYNFIPIPGGMGIADYLMIDGFQGMMGEQMAYNVEIISRSLMFYVCITVSGLITLAGYLWGVRKEKAAKHGGKA